MSVSKALTFLKNHCRPLIALFFSLLGLYLRYQRFVERELWVDEVFTLKNTVGPFKPAWQRLSNGELTCFPGQYLMTYPFVHFFGPENKWGFSIPHILSAVLGFYLLYLICNKHLKTILGFTIAFVIMTFNGNLIFHAFEFRPYAVLPTLSLAVFYFSEMIICQAKDLGRMKKFLIGAFFVATVIYHAYGILIVACCMLFFVFSQTPQKTYKEIMKDILPFAGPLFLISFPIFLWYASGTIVQITESRNTFDVYPNPLNDLWRFLKMVFANLIAEKKFKQKLLVYGIWISFLLPHKERAKQIGFFLMLIILPIELILFSDALKGYWFLDRQFIWVMSLYAFFLGWCWDSIFLFSAEQFKKVKIKWKN